MDVIAAADFFTVDALTLRGLVRFYIFFVVKVRTRRMHIAGISHTPSGEWMLQMARDLLDTEDGFLRHHRFVILDRDPL